MGVLMGRLVNRGVGWATADRAVRIILDVLAKASRADRTELLAPRLVLAGTLMQAAAGLR
jgi:hypothetical protein